MGWEDAPRVPAETESEVIRRGAHELVLQVPARTCARARAHAREAERVERRAVRAVAVHLVRHDGEERARGDARAVPERDVLEGAAHERHWRVRTGAGAGLSYLSEEASRSRSGSRGRAPDGAHVVSEQAARVLQKGIGWLLGADDE